MAVGSLFAALAIASTFLALRAAPVGFDERQRDLEALAERIGPDDDVVFLGVDRFAGYYLRGTLTRSPGGYVPAEIGARTSKTWQQGQQLDFDNLDSMKLNRQEYAITTASGYQSTPPPNWEQVAREGDYVLWGGGEGASLRGLARRGRRFAGRGPCACSGASPRCGAWFRRGPTGFNRSGSQDCGARASSSRRGTARPVASRPRPEVGALAPVPLAGAAHRERWTARRSRSSPRRARGLLPGRRGAGAPSGRWARYDDAGASSRSWWPRNRAVFRTHSTCERKGLARAIWRWPASDIAHRSSTSRAVRRVRGSLHPSVVRE